MSLPTKEPRCTGGDGEGSICPERDKCLRYIHRLEGGIFTQCENFYTMPLFKCENKMEAPSGPHP